MPFIEGEKPWRAVEGTWLGRKAAAVLDKHGHTLFLIRDIEIGNEIVRRMNSSGRWS